MPNINLSILNQKATPAFFADTLANRPAPSFVGRIFISTDTYDLYRDTGSAWVLLSPSSTGTITGGGSLYRVGIWTSTSNLGESNDLVFDYSQGHLGINTNTPGTALDVHHDQPTIAILNQTIATNDARLGFQNNGVGLWRIGNFYNAGANDFAVYDAVNSLERFSVKNTGQTFVGAQISSSGKLVVNQTASDNGIVVIGTTAPSIRLSNGGTGATQRIGVGLSTGVNNFIQGSASGDFCVFNSSTTASPILFGVYDAGLGNTQEAARISASRNFLIGTNTDAGQKLQVNGDASVSTQLITPKIGPITATDLQIQTNNTVRATFLGNTLGLGIGTATPTGALEVVGLTYLTRGSQQLLINPNYFSLNTKVQIQTVGNMGIAFATNGDNERMQLSNIGNLLIGTTTDAGQKLQVNGTSLFSDISTFGNTIYAPERNIYLSYQTSAIRSVSSAGTQSLTLDMKSIFADFNYSSNYTSLIVNTMVGASSIIINIWISASGTGSYNVVSTVGSTTITNVTFSGTASNPIVTITASAIVYWKATLIANAT